MTMRTLCVRAAIGAAALLAVWAAVLPASAQSLGEVARREEARRKAIKVAVKLYTNDNLVRIPGETIPTPPGPSQAPPKPDMAKPATDTVGGGSAQAAAPKDAPLRTQEYWQKRIGDARDLLNRNSVYQEAVQTRINVLWADFTSRDDPVQRNLIGVQRQKSIDELDRLRKEKTDLEKQIAAIEEEARRAGVPPGWLR